MDTWGLHSTVGHRQEASIPADKCNVDTINTIVNGKFQGECKHSETQDSLLMGGQRDLCECEPHQLTQEDQREANCSIDREKAFQAEENSEYEKS